MMFLSSGVELLIRAAVLVAAPPVLASPPTPAAAFSPPVSPAVSAPSVPAGWCVIR